MNGNGKGPISLFVGCPAYGPMKSLHKFSHMQLMAELAQRGIPIQYSDVANESIISKARNTLAHQMLRIPTTTHFLMTDIDIGFSPSSILEMIAADKPVIAAPCSAKVVNWDAVRRALALHPDATDDDLEGCCGRICINQKPLGGYDLELKFSEPLQVLEAGAGIMLIQRYALEEYMRAYPDEWYYDTFKEPRGAKYWDFFPTLLDKQTRTYLSEDYAFCRRYQAIGGSVFIAPWVKTQHVGDRVYRGNLVDMVKCLEEPQKVM